MWLCIMNYLNLEQMNDSAFKNHTTTVANTKSYIVMQTKPVRLAAYDAADAMCVINIFVVDAHTYCQLCFCIYIAQYKKGYLAQLLAVAPNVTRQCSPYVLLHLH